MHLKEFKIYFICKKLPDQVHAFNMSFRCFSFIFLYETVKLSREYERHSSYAKRSKNTVALARNVLVARELRVVALQGGVEVF